MATRKRNKPTGFVTWHVPPVDQGQMIEHAYGVDDEGERWQRVTDRSTRTVRYRALGHASEGGSWEPWNRPPSIARARRDQPKTEKRKEMRVMAKRRKTARKTTRGKRRSVRDLVSKYQSYQRDGGAIMAVSGSPGRKRAKKKKPAKKKAKKKRLVAFLAKRDRAKRAARSSRSRRRR